ncbi:MAG: family 16 glycoside hydrolase [Planctomycetota bacterium]|jgi:hypothetical protein
MSCVVALLLLAQPAELAPGDHPVLKQLTAVEESGLLVFHYDAGKVKGPAVRQAVQRNRGFFRYLEKTLRLRYEGRIHLFLYENAAHLKAVTGVGAPAFSRGTCSIHLPHDYDDAHEMVHIFALQIPKGEESLPPDRFFMDGLATALQLEDNGIAIDDYAALSWRVGRLPRLVDLRRSFPEGSLPGVHPYHVAGSFIGFLIDTFGIEKVKALYVNCLECQGILGRSFARLEREWWNWLAERKVGKKEEQLLLQRFGFVESRLLPRDLAKAKSTALFDDRTLNDWNLEHPGSWTVKNRAIVGTSPGPWHRMHTKKRWTGDIAVRVRLRLLDGNAVQVRLNRDATRANEAIFATWESYLVKVGPGGGIVAKSPYRILPGRWIEIVFVNRGGAVRVFVDGLLVLEGKDLTANEGSVGLSVERGPVEVKQVELLELP